MNKLRERVYRWKNERKRFGESDWREKEWVKLKN